MNADPQLLFGLMAMQNGLINQAQLIAAFQAWIRDGGQPLAEHLVALGALEPDDRIAVDALLARHLKKHGGDAEKSLGAIPAGRSTRERLAALGDPRVDDTLRHVGSGQDLTEPESDRTTTYATTTVSSVGQRYRVLRPHAQGGLGAVFIALDSELRREVALKKMLERHANDDMSRQRFLLEAEITAGLEHPGVVPVYGLGTHGDGQPYYAMRFVRGESLKVAIERFHADESLKRHPGQRSLELRKLLRKYLDVCNAIAYAHSRGVLHRDIKPSNVLVGRYGETLVIDWGLAKAVGMKDRDTLTDERPISAKLSGVSGETLPGTAVGTPAYMSPEQARGNLELLDPRADVYSLGATLYCLLVGKPPFEGDAGAVIRRVQAGEFVSPRKLVPALDPALEAVCLKAMALRPVDRYATPRDLVDDIERWNADEPVSAYREPLRARAARWERRHKTLVNTGVILLAISAVGLGVSGMLISREKRLTEQAKEIAEINSRTAQNNLRTALEAVLMLQSQVADSEFNRIPHMEGVRRRLTDRAVAVFERSIRGSEWDPRLFEMSERVYRDAALVRSLTGDFAAAKQAYEKSIEVSQKLIKMRGVDRVSGGLRLGAGYRDMARFLDDNGHDDEAAAYFAKAKTSAEEFVALLAEVPPGRLVGIRWMAGWNDAWVGEFELKHGNLEPARRAFEHCIEMLTPVVQNPKAWYWYRLFLSVAHRGLAMIARETGDAATWGEELDKSLRIAREVFKEVADPDAPNHLAIVLVERGDWLDAQPGLSAEAQSSFDEAVALLRGIVGEFPATTWYKSDLALALLARATWRASKADDAGLARLGLRQGRGAEANKLLERSVKNLEYASKARPANVRNRKSLAEALEAKQASTTATGADQNATLRP
jgi:serine/threonine protein kinase